MKHLWNETDRERETKSDKKRQKETVTDNDRRIFKCVLL